MVFRIGQRPSYDPNIMKYTFLGKEISGCFTIPSGIITTQKSVIEKIGREIPEIGIITTKSIWLHPREGYREPGEATARQRQPC